MAKFYPLIAGQPKKWKLEIIKGENYFLRSYKLWDTNFMHVRKEKNIDEENIEQINQWNENPDSSPNYPRFITMYCNSNLHWKSAWKLCYMLYWWHSSTCA